jgi:hypothetical protein
MGMSDIKVKVHKMILENSRGGTPPAVFLDKMEWVALFEACQADMWPPHGTPISSEDYLKKGYDNFMFYGSAICIMPPSTEKVGNDNG